MSRGFLLSNSNSVFEKLGFTILTSSEKTMMDHERFDYDNTDEVMLPGFRFHPTDEELVGFYLTRKIQHKTLSVELIKQIDIYKYDPWDLPKLSVTGEKEWYFYCPRDRKYRNSARPNRVTGAGFWKATGTDRPIYSSEGSKCIGLKKSLVFYKGRAAKGIKTDWMMHEFRLPPDSDSMKKYLEKNIPTNEAWALCRIFKKASSNTQRALSNSWISPVLDDNTVSDVAVKSIHFNSSNIQFGFYKDLEEQQSSIASFSPLHLPPCQQPVFQMENKTFQVLSHEHHPIPSCTTNVMPPNDTSPFFLDVPSSLYGEFVKGSETVDFSTFSEPYKGLCNNNVHDENAVHAVESMLVKDQVDDRLVAMRSMEFCYSYPPLNSPGAWNPDLVWVSSSPCPSELSSSYSTNKCYS